MTQKRQEHAFSPDRPIESEAEDLLGRAAFSRGLAKAVSGWRERDSLVIALFGPWGSGKTSIKNLMLEELSKQDGNGPRVLEFNPWQFSGQDELHRAFFREIGLVVGRDETEEKRRRFAKRLDAYAAYLLTGSIIIRGLPSGIVWSLLLASVAGLLGSAVPRVHIYALAVCMLAIGVAALFRWGGTLLKNISDSLVTMAEAREKSMSELKVELAADLQGMKKPVLVVMDDIDRLTPEECLLLFQLIKANADFPNIVYLLLFERGAVEKRISVSTGLEGSDYLDKIVQVPLDVPAVDGPRLQSVLTAEIDKLILDLGLADRFDQRRWLNLFAGGLSPYFQTLRDVRRFLSALSFTLGIFRNNEAFEVNPVDLTALEILRLFEPGVYRKLPVAKQTLTRLEDRSLYAQPAEDTASREAKAIADSATDAGRQRVEQILKQLFPPIEWAFGGSRYSTNFSTNWLLEQRVCHSDMFDRYFQLAIPEGQVSQARMEIIISATGDRERLVTEFQALKEEGLLGAVLRLLSEAYKDKVPLDNAVPFITAIYDIGDEIPKEATGITGVGTSLIASLLPYWYLKRESDPAKRSGIMVKVAEKITGVGMVAYLIQSEKNIRARGAGSNLLLLLDEDIPKVQQIFLQKIPKLGSESRPKLGTRVAEMLYCWLDLAPEEAKRWAEQLASTPGGTIAILVGFLQPFSKQVLGERVQTSDWLIDLNQVDQFVKVEALQKNLKAIETDKLGDLEKRAILAFLEALQRRESEKAGASPLDRLMEDGGSD
ncbi:MAG TPA: P-loop NTPase fold protein [Terriglobia bacterium]|nr:P-loop NTPase fold protein [Terriglobia bacterium]